MVLGLTACGSNETHPAHQPYVGDATQPLSCVPNLDGKIEASELQPSIGPSISYLVTSSDNAATFDLGGQVDDQGHRVWDWSTDLRSDRLLKVAASRLTEKWYKGSFPSDAYTTPLDATLDGVYRSDDQALWLLGVASADENPAEGQTLLVYSDPIALFRFPIQPGASWTSVSNVRNATIRGVPYASRDTYEVDVDTAGELALPDLTFTQVHRVRMKTTKEPAAGLTMLVDRQESFLFECFGEVARATGKTCCPGPEGCNGLYPTCADTNINLNTADQIRRIGLE